MAAAAVAGITAPNIPPLIGGGPRFDTNRPSLLQPNKREDEVNILSPTLPYFDLPVKFFGRFNSCLFGLGPFFQST
jgi:hypothetical protein